MAFLDTLKNSVKSVGSAIGKAVAPVASPIIGAGIKGLSALGNMQAKSAASLAPSSQGTTSAPKAPAAATANYGQLGPAVNPSGGSYLNTGPITNVSSGTSTNPGSQPKPATQSTQMAVPKAAPVNTPSVNTPSVNTNQNTNQNTNPNFSFGQVTYGQDSQNLINQRNALMNNNYNSTDQSLTPPATGYVNQPPPSGGASGYDDSTLRSLQDELLKSYQMSPEERALMAQQADIERQMGDLRSATRSGMTKIGEQPIVMNLLRGQQQALQNQGLDALNALTDSSKPLESQLASLQAQRSSTQQGATAALGFENERAKLEQAKQAAQAKGYEPIEMGGSLIQLNPQTGKYDVIYSPPAKEEKPTANVAEYEYAQSNGYNGSFMDFQRDQKTSNTSRTDSEKIVMVDGKPNFLRNGVLVPVQTEGISSGNQTKIGTIDTLLSAVDSVMNHPGLKSRVGWQGGLPAAPGTQGADFDSQLDFMKGQFERMGVDLLRGLGAMSEGERQAMTKSLAAISKTQSEASFMAELGRIKEVFSNQRGILQNGNGAITSTQQMTSQQVMRGANISQEKYDALANRGYTPGEIAEAYGVSFKNDQMTSQNSSPVTKAITSFKPNGAYGGQCGAFVHNFVSNYPYGLNGINEKESIINVPKQQPPRVGDVVIQRIGGQYGHVAVVNHIDPYTGKIMLTESNYGKNERVTNNRQIAYNDPSVSGYFRGSLAV